MEIIVNKLASLRPIIAEIVARAGTAGLTYGVIHHRNVIHTENFGYRDVESSLPVNEDTVFQVASLTKSMIAAAIGMLVEDGLMQWDTPIKNILPEFHIEDPIVYNSITIVDCLAHRTGLQINNYWLQSNNNIIIPLKDSMKFLNSLKPVKPFRGQFQYNNLGYEIAGHVIQKLSGMTWDQMLRFKIFQPVGMHRTGTHSDFCEPGNTSKEYGTLSSGKPVQIGKAQIGDNTLAGAAGGVRSTLNDMLKLVKVWLETGDHQFRTGETSTPGSPLKQVNHIMSAQTLFDSPSYHETSYAMGWVRVQLPGPMGAIGANGTWMPEGMPLVGKSSLSQPKLVLYHQGSNPGVLAAANLLLETQSAVVVLSNTFALNDTADWIGQLLLESILDVKEKNDYLQLAKNTVERALAWYPAMAAELRENRTLEAPRSFNEYVGNYYNAANTVHIDVTYENNQLKLSFQGLADEIWDLHHYEYDTFTWLPESRDVIASRGRFSYQSPEYYKIKFGVSAAGRVQQLTWIHEGLNIPGGEDFFRSYLANDGKIYEEKQKFLER